jgi:hypothetical protein
MLNKAPAQVSPLEQAVRAAQDSFDATALAVEISRSLREMPVVLIPTHKRNLKTKDVMAGIERCYECWQKGLDRPSPPQPGERLPLRPCHTQC